MYDDVDLNIALAKVTDHHCINFSSVSISVQCRSVLYYITDSSYYIPLNWMC